MPRKKTAHRQSRTTHKNKNEEGVKEKAHEAVEGVKGGVSNVVEGIKKAFD
jgi:MoaA/NifB/PqqE/SkfB family radical SAM enzyme